VTKYPRYKDIGLEGGSNLENKQYFENCAIFMSKISQSVVQVDWNKGTNAMGSLISPELIYLPLWVTKYPRYKDIGLKRGQIWKINKILRIVQYSGLKISQRVVQVD
jgi:hypothetical protein